MLTFWRKRTSILGTSIRITRVDLNYRSTVQCNAAKHFTSKGSGGVPVSSQLLIEKEKLSSTVSVPAKPGPRTEVENLLRDIANINTAEKLSDLLESSNFARVDDRDFNALFGGLFKAVRYETSDVAKKQLLNSVGMQKLMKTLRHYCRFLNVGELITAVKFFVFLNTPASNPTLQMLLRLISTQANSMTLSELIYVSFLLEKIGSSTVVAALQMALPVIFESQIVSKLDATDPTQLTDALYYAVKHNLSEVVLQKITEPLIEHLNDLSPRQNLSVIWSIADSKRKILNQELVVIPALQGMSNTFEYLNEDEITTTFAKLSKKYGKSAPYFYNEDLVGKYCQYLVEPNRDPLRVLFALRAVTQMRHVDISYLDRVAEVILNDPTLILNNDFLFAIVMKGFSSANYKPENWDKLKPILMNHPLLTKDVEMSSFPLALYFLSLDCFPEKLIEKIFSPPSFTLLEQYIKFHSAYIPLLILKSVKLLYPDYPGPFPPSFMVNEWKSSVIKIPKTYPLKEALKAGIGGTNYVLSGLFHEGFHIDHAVAFRKGGYPVALDVTEPIALEDLKLPPESEIVMVKVLMPESYASNTNRLRGIYAHELKLIENLGYSVIAIDSARWKELLDSEKIPFLMHKIREKSELTTTGAS